MLGIAAGVLVIAGSVLAAKTLFGPAPNAAAGDVGRDADERHLGVLYFADESKDGSLRFLADGLTESLIDELSRVRRSTSCPGTGCARIAACRTTA